MKTSPIHFINQVSLIAFVSSFQICNQILAAIFSFCAIMWKREVNKNIITLLQLLTIRPILDVKSSNNYHSHREIQGFTNLKTLCTCVIGCWSYRQSSMNDRQCCAVLRPCERTHSSSPDNSGKSTCRILKLITYLKRSQKIEQEQSVQ